jgi:hypothetical protein
LQQNDAQTELLVDLGASHAQAALIAGGQVLRVSWIHATELAEMIDRITKQEPGKAEELLKNVNLDAPEPASVPVRDALAATLRKIAPALGLEDGNAPQPSRVLLCGGMAAMRGAAEMANSIMNVSAEIMAQPQGLGSVGSAGLPAPYPVFAGAIGAALRAAGAAPLPLMPRRQRQPVRSLAAPAATKEGLARERRNAAIRIALRAWESIRQSGWRWVTAGAVALAILLPTIRLLSRQTTSEAQARRDLEMLEPDTAELARQARLLRTYAVLTGAGRLTLMPWGAVIAEIAERMPAGTYLTGVNANGDRLFVQGRVEGNLGEQLRHIIERFRQAPVLKRQGLIPPAM